MAAPELRGVQRHLTTSRRELRRAVARFAAVDALEGHRAEALRLMRDVHVEAERAVRVIGGAR